jgi:hypothetical protein
MSKENCCGSCPAGCVIEVATASCGPFKVEWYEGEATPVPPAVTQFALAERQRLLDRIAELEAHAMRLGQGEAERYWENRWREADTELAALKAQPSGAAIAKYEAALLEAFPHGASGRVFDLWNAARIITNSTPNHNEQVQDSPLSHGSRCDCPICRASRK